MTVNFQSATTTNQATAAQKYVPTVNVANSTKLPAPKNEVIKADTLEKTEDRQEKKSAVSKVSSFIGNIKKAFASAGEYTKGFFKGIAGGAVAGSLVYTGSTVLKAIKKKPSNKAGKALAILTAGGTFVYNMYKAYLNSNEAKANIDHRYR